MPLERVGLEWIAKRRY